MKWTILYSSVLFIEGYQVGLLIKSSEVPSDNMMLSYFEGNTGSADLEPKAAGLRLTRCRTFSELETTPIIVPHIPNAGNHYFQTISLKKCLPVESPESGHV
ncbi:hypothetical protein C0J52_00467 [Blattella germanica]|nr:hypothetical protein C0J52_00467 [Blattella germanica]